MGLCRNCKGYYIIFFWGEEKPFYIPDPPLPQKVVLLHDLAVKYPSESLHPEQDYGPYSGLDDVGNLYR